MSAYTKWILTYTAFVWSQIILDALLLAGTNPSLTIVRDWILDGRLSGEQAVQAVSMLPATVKTPTKQLLSSLMV